MGTSKGKTKFERKWAALDQRVLMHQVPNQKQRRTKEKPLLKNNQRPKVKPLLPKVKPVLLKEKPLLLTRAETVKPKPPLMVVLMEATVEPVAMASELIAAWQHCVAK